MNLILLELNEINFEVAKYYIDDGEELPGFKKLFDNGVHSTESEHKYSNLEPWIQWPSVHTGKSYEEHGVFRLGDFINSDQEQFFEKVERAGYKVGAISPMNASNRLKNPTYFIPDPWTQTSSDDSYFSKSISKAINQAVNDNSKSKLTITTILNLCFAFIALVSPLRYYSMMKYALGCFGKPWRKALFLDMFLYEVHKKLLKKNKTNFSTLFLNAGAHIQHHYFFNSPFVKSDELQNPSWYIGHDQDPILEMLRVYDLMLLDLLDIKNSEIIIATGLSQKPYEKLKFYYRLKEHNTFLKNMGLDFIKVEPRMTRDFLISFNSLEKADLAEEKLASILVNNKHRLFDEIDNRGTDIFVVLSYPYEITEKTVITINGNDFKLKDLVTFVAIKNGEHQSKGFSYFSKNLLKYSPKNESHVSAIHKTVLDFFGINNG